MTLTEIIISVSKDYRVTKTKLCGTIVRKDVNEARKVIVKVAHNCGYTLEAIGQALGGRGKSWASKSLNSDLKINFHTLEQMKKYFLTPNK